MLQSMGSQRVEHNQVTEHQQKANIYFDMVMRLYIKKKKVKHSKLSMPRCSLGTRFTF